MKKQIKGGDIVTYNDEQTKERNYRYGNPMLIVRYIHPVHGVARVEYTTNRYATVYLDNLIKVADNPGWEPIDPFLDNVPLKDPRTCTETINSIFLKLIEWTTHQHLTLNDMDNIRQMLRVRHQWAVSDSWHYRWYLDNKTKQGKNLVSKDKYQQYMKVITRAVKLNNQ